MTTRRAPAPRIAATAPTAPVPRAIRHDDRPRRSAVDAHQHARAPGAGRIAGGRLDAAFAQPVARADGDAALADAALDARAGPLEDVARIAEAQAATLGVMDERFGHHVRRELVDGRREPQELGGLQDVGRVDPLDRRLAERQGSRLV
jgi:hypothetical protein